MKSIIFLLLTPVFTFAKADITQKVLHESNVPIAKSVAIIGNVIYTADHSVFVSTKVVFTML